MEVYGLNLWAAMDSDMEPGFVAAPSVQLPPGCRWRVAHDPDAWWTGERMLLAGILNDQRGLIWGLADHKKRGAPPKLIGPSTLAKDGARKLAAIVMSRDELLEALSRPRKEVDDG